MTGYTRSHESPARSRSDCTRGAHAGPDRQGGRVGGGRRGRARASPPTAWPRSCAARTRTASSTWATSTRPARAGVPAVVPPALRTPRAHHLAHDRQPRVGQPLRRLLPLLVSPQGRAPPALVQDRDRRLGDLQPEFAGPARGRVASGALARVGPGRSCGGLPHRVLAPARATARGPTAARRT